MDLRLVMTTVPDEEFAQRISLALVQEKLAACVSSLPITQSVYVWQGNLQKTAEIQLVIKTVSWKLEELAMRLSELHPYELPEFVVIKPEAAGTAWMSWVRTHTGGAQ